MRLILNKKLTCCVISFLLVLVVKRLLFNSSECDGPVRNPARIFCIVLTDPSRIQTQARAAHDTWTRECDGVRFITKIPSNLTNHEFDIMPLLQPDGFYHESYENLTNKVYLAFRHIYGSSFGQYDWYLKCDDDTFVFMAHLRQFLADKKPCEPVSYGYNIKYWFNVKAWQSGGAGYVMSQKSWHLLNQRLKASYESCPNTGSEDQDVSNCLYQVGVYPGQSRDQLGRERFHPYSISQHYSGQMPSWIRSISEKYPKYGPDCCSESSISYHYVNATTMRLLDKLWREYRLQHDSSFFNLVLKPVM